MINTFQGEIFGDERQGFSFYHEISFLRHEEGDLIRNLISVEEIWFGARKIDLRRSPLVDLDVKPMSGKDQRR